MVSAQFPVHIVDVVERGWQSDPSLRPTFSQILQELEPHAPVEEQRRFVWKQSNEESTDEGEVSDFDEADLAEPKSVSKLKSQFEQLRQCGKPPEQDGRAGLLSGTYKPNGTVEKLRQRLDQNGYVAQSQAARAFQAAKSAAQLRDSIVLARNGSIAQRQHAFTVPDQQPTGNFTSHKTANSVTVPVLIGAGSSEPPNRHSDSESSTLI